MPHESSVNRPRTEKRRSVEIIAPASPRELTACRNFEKTKMPFKSETRTAPTEKRMDEMINNSRGKEAKRRRPYTPSFYAARFSFRHLLMEPGIPHTNHIRITIRMKERRAKFGLVSYKTVFCYDFFLQQGA